MVVGVQPGVKGGAAFGFGGVGPGVGPFVGQGAVVALDLAVGLGPVGAGALGGDAELGAGGGPEPGSVAGAVVAEDALDGDPGGGVPGVCAGQERGGGVLALIAQDLGIGQAGAVVQGGVQVTVADDGVAVAGAPGRGGGGLAVAPARLAAVDAPAAAVGDVDELFDVDVDQFAGAGPLVAADAPPAAAVQVRQWRAAV